MVERDRVAKVGERGLDAQRGCLGGFLLGGRRRGRRLLRGERERCAVGDE
jgi:hypothetical protein